MRTPALRTLGILILGCSIPHFAHAWGDDGHRIVGLIAEHYLDPGVKTQVDAILSGDTTGLVPATDIADEATWADKYRDSDRNTTKLHYNATHYWHYVDIEIASPDIDGACFQHPAVPAGTLASAAAPKDCVVDKVDQFAKELADPSTAVNERRLALEFLLHFVGDLHQPLHSSDSNDQGGNAKKVTGCGTGGSNLHSCWDTPLVTKLGADDASIANALIAQITAAQQTQWQAGTPTDWAQEAFQLAKTEAYGKLPAPGSGGSYALDSAYVSNGQQVVRQQLSRAGVRLAMVLNRALTAGGGTGGSTGGGTGGSTTGSTGGIELLGNPGFENGSTKPAPWTASAGVISNSSSEPAHGGQWDAWLDGYGTKTTDTLYQTLTVPGGSAAVTLSFWLHIDTDETTTTQTFDTLKVQVLGTTGKILATLATYSNLDAAPGYVQKSFDLSAYRGQKIKIRFTGSEDNGKRTSFVIDDVSAQ